MSKDKAPREWWIDCDDIDEDKWMWAHAYEQPGCVRVIEKSAYDALEAKLAKIIPMIEDLLKILRELSVETKTDVEWGRLHLDRAISEYEKRKGNE